MKALLPVLLSSFVATAGALCAPAERTALVDGEGVLRWEDDGGEVALFGVNYYVPFSIDYRVIETRGLDHEQTIRDDVAHFARLGLDVIRLHCWDREISDHEGNLVDNRHLELLDLLIAECKARGIYSVMTPIAWWGSPVGGGFSDLYAMHEMTTDLRARAAQERFLQEFLNHVNRYTGLAYKDDPAIIAVEHINEPLYPPGTTDEQVTEYIDALTRAVRDTGTRKPTFYNCWAGRIGAAAASSVDGVSFGWYPTGLVNGVTLRDDYLSRVDDYPSMRDERLATKAKIVYEFDAADVHGSVMYPAMARAFRSGGAQIATQFQYDPICIADANQNWQTHYLNLIYTPQKAISFAIAAEAFRRTPRLERFGQYPDSARFGDFRLSFEEDLSEMVTEDAFLHSNDTATVPPAPDRLERVWGCGSSPVVSYAGTGAHFLDRLADGYWRLQVYPDAVMIADPYTGGPSEKVRCLWAAHEMQVRLPDLGEGFRVRALDAASAPRVEGRAMIVEPGEYILARAGAPEPLLRMEPLGFIAPPPGEAVPAAYIDAPETWREGRAMQVRATVAMTGEPSCVLHFRPADETRYVELPMRRTRVYEYEAAVPAELLRAGGADFYLSARDDERVVTFPGGAEGERTAADLASVPPVDLVAVREGDELPPVGYGGPEGMGARASITAGREAGSAAVRVEADGFGPPPSCVSIRFPTGPLPDDLSPYNAVRFVARGGVDTSAAEITLIQSDGNAFGYNLPLGPAWRDVTVPIARLIPMWSTRAPAPDPALVHEVSIIFGAWQLGDLADRPHAVEVQTVQLCRRPDVHAVDIAPADAPIVLIAPATRPVAVHGRRATRSIVGGMDPDREALRLAVAGFGPEPDATSFRLPLADSAAQWREHMAQATHLTIKARAGRPETTRLELVLIERDETPWGTEIPLTQEWQAIRIPLGDLRFFSHWRRVEGRGGEGDALRPDNIREVNICFGAWLYGEDAGKPHAIEVQEVSLGQE